MDGGESDVHGCVKERLVLLQDKGSIVITIYVTGFGKTRQLRTNIII